MFQQPRATGVGPGHRCPGGQSGGEGDTGKGTRNLGGAGLGRQACPLTLGLLSPTPAAEGLSKGGLLRPIGEAFLEEEMDVAQPPKDRLSSVLPTGQPGGKGRWPRAPHGTLCYFEGPGPPGRGRGLVAGDLASAGQWVGQGFRLLWCSGVTGDQVTWAKVELATTSSALGQPALAHWQ